MSRGIGEDGIKRGTNYIHRAKLAARADMAPRQIAAAAAQRARCTQGEHARKEAEKRRVTYISGRQVAPGTRYCPYCLTILGHPWWVANLEDDHVPGGQLVDAPNQRTALARFRAAMVEHFMGHDSKRGATDRVRALRPIITRGPMTQEEARTHALGWAWAWAICDLDKAARTEPGAPADRELAERLLGNGAAHIEREIACQFASDSAPA